MTMQTKFLPTVHHNMIANDHKTKIFVSRLFAATEQFCGAGIFKLGSQNSKN
jgi:hypothetical protein